MPISKHRIGRRPHTGPLVRAFDVEWDEVNKVAVIKNSDSRNGPSVAEKRHIDAHFQSPIVALSGGVDKSGRHYDGPIKPKPGTLEHFSTAVYQIPKPFMRMA